MEPGFDGSMLVTDRTAGEDRDGGGESLLRLRPLEPVDDTDAVVFDPHPGRVLREDRFRELPGRAADLLELLVRRAPEVVSREEIVEEVWAGRPVTDSTISDTVRAIRRVLGDRARQARFVRTVPQRGYRFVGNAEPVERPAAALRPPARPRPQHAAPLGVGLLVGGVVGLLALLTVIAGSLTGSPEPVDPRRPLAARLALDSNLSLDEWAGPAVALAPDGSSVAYVTRDDDETRGLRLLSLESAHSRTLGEPGTGARAPFFSPDGASVGYLDRGRIMVLDVEGNSPGPRQVAAVPRSLLATATWASARRIVVSPGRGHGLWTVDLEAGTVEPLTRLREDEASHLWPAATPDGRHVLFTAVPVGAGDGSEGPIQAISLDGSGRRMVTSQSGSRPRVLGSTELLFAQGQELWSGRIDADSLTVREVTLLPEVRPFRWTGGAPHVDTSRLGDAILVEGPENLGPATLWWIEIPYENEWPLDATVGKVYRDLRISADGRHLATVIDGDLWTYEFTTDHFSRLVASPTLETDPVWRPAGDTITYAANRGRSFDLFESRLDRPGHFELLRGEARDLFPSSWSSDGRLLALTVIDPVTGADIYLYDPDADELSPLVASPADEWGARFSPDGTLLAYTRDDAGTRQVMAVSTEGSTPVAMTMQGGHSPAWGPDGDSLWFRQGRGYLEIGLELQPRIRRRSLELRFAQPDPAYEFALSLDGGVKPLVTRRQELDLQRRLLLLHGGLPIAGHD